MISIHAPTRGATLSAFFGIYYCFKFQSTLPREERRTCRPEQICTFTDFNPRSHERSDAFQFRASSALLYFNPRSHERSDWHITKRRKFLIISIHAPTRGATDVSVLILNNEFYFNPRSHERSDLTNLMINIAASISIHAPTRGATYIRAFK